MTLPIRSRKLLDAEMIKIDSVKRLSVLWPYALWVFNKNK